VPTQLLCEQVADRVDDGRNRASARLVARGAAWETFASHCPWGESGPLSGEPQPKLNTSEKARTTVQAQTAYMMR
jgi:hypothetical protein